MFAKIALIAAVAIVSVLSDCDDNCYATTTTLVGFGESSVGTMLSCGDDDTSFMASTYDNAECSGDAITTVAFAGATTCDCGDIGSYTAEGYASDDCSGDAFFVTEVPFIITDDTCAAYDAAGVVGECVVTEGVGSGKATAIDGCSSASIVVPPVFALVAFIALMSSIVM